MATTGSGARAWTVVVATGIIAAMHVWKLPSALEFIREDLHISLVAAGALVGVVQLAGAFGGLAASVVSERIGAKYTLVVGMLFAGIASVAGGLAVSAAWLMIPRAMEAMGLSLITVAAPGVGRRLPQSLQLTEARGGWVAFKAIALFLVWVFRRYCSTPPR